MGCYLAATAAAIAAATFVVGVAAKAIATTAAHQEDKDDNQPSAVSGELTRQQLEKQFKRS